MALIYMRTTVEMEDREVEIRALEEDDYVIGLSFKTNVDDDEVVEVLLTEAEVRHITDLTFNS